MKSYSKAVGCLLVLLLISCTQGQPAVKYTPGAQNPAVSPERWGFDADPAGGIPAGATVFSGTWAIQSQPDAPSPPNVLCQTGSAEYPALSLSDTVYTDVAVVARFKPVSGKSDQAAGIILRVQDGRNYYIVRANALENNVNIYRYAGGVRSGIREGSAKVSTGQWQELRAEVAGNRIRGFLNGQMVVEATHDTYRAGRIGLWTKSDSVTCFDDVEVSLP